MPQFSVCPRIGWSECCRQHFPRCASGNDRRCRRTILRPSSLAGRPSPSWTQLDFVRTSCTACVTRWNWVLAVFSRCLQAQWRLRHARELYCHTAFAAFVPALPTACAFVYGSTASEGTEKRWLASAVALPDNRQCSSSTISFPRTLEAISTC